LREQSAVNAKILLVDDDQENLKALTLYLQLEGFVVEQAHDGFEALVKLDHQTFDVVVSDIRMPRLDGVDLTKRIRYKLQSIPVVLMTGDPGFAALEAIDGVMCLLLKRGTKNNILEFLNKEFFGNLEIPLADSFYFVYFCLQNILCWTLLCKRRSVNQTYFSHA
jgi:CheY-like chemotaxis protein